MQSAVRSMIEATIETAYTPASTRLRRKSVKPPPAPPRWRTLLTVIYSKLRTKRSWVAVMFVLGTVDMALNLVNFIQTSSPDLSYGLVIGPPTRDLWISMCVFTVFGTLLYIPETINTFSALYSPDGETIIPLHFELPITLLLEHIPLAATDYFVARCRREYTTDVDSFCGVIRLVFIFIRLVWYAHIEGKKIKKNDKYEIRQLLIMTCCLLISVAIAFPIMNWRYENEGKLKFHHLVNVSIYMLKRDPPPEGRSFNLDLTELLQSQGWSETNTSLVPSAWAIHQAYKAHRTVTAYYNCRHGATEKPPECNRNGAQYLQFQFQYKPVKDISPYGEISYNYAEICLDENKLNASATHAADDGNGEDDDHDDFLESPYLPYCREAKQPLTGGWRLFYFTTNRWHSKRKVRFNVTEPFWKVYTSPMPKYSSEIVICRNSTKNLCSKPNYDLKSINEDDCPEELDLHQRFSL